MTDFERKEIFEKVATIVAQKLHIDRAKITEQATLHDLGADSLDLVEIIMKIEDEFEIQVDDAKAETLKNVGDVVTYISTLKHK